ncbi:MAG: hypothetical protein P8099_05590 [Gemmatimonadota bacterium]|jgi:hypothetical protein
MDRAPHAEPPELARETPYELVFGPETFEETLFPSIRDEVEERDVDAADPERFVFLTSVGRLLRMIAGDVPSPAAGPDAEAVGRAADAAEARQAADTAVREHGHLLFQAYNFWTHGCQLFLLEPEALAAVLAVTGADDAELRAPHPAGYVQLPRHRVWARAAGPQPEPVDGVFWTMSSEREDGPARLDLLLVLGMRPDRAGFSVVPVGATLEADGRPGDWSTNARPDGDDFANTLPGGELEELVSLETQAEALKLMALLFRYLERYPESLGTVTRNPPDASASSPHALPPSSLAYRRIRARSPS